jgi:type II secretory pathway pseudopilin PulG
MTPRRGVSLVEALVVVGVLGTMVGLLLPAVQRVRVAAARAAAINDQKQIAMALHAFAAGHGGLLPTIDGRPKQEYIPDLKLWGRRMHEQVFIDILPHLGATRDRTQEWPHYVPTYVNRADPSLFVTSTGPHGANPMAQTYPCNAQIFVGFPHLSRTITDGLSNTVMLAEHYHVCKPHIVFDYTQHEAFPTLKGGGRRATFADGGPLLDGANQGDVYPVTEPATRTTRPSRPGATFQVTPRVWSLDVVQHPRPAQAGECDQWLPQAVFPNGLLVALADGSVRTVRPGVSPEVFWGAVTPAGGEVLADW